MGDKVTLTVEERKILGKKVKQLRKQGLVPGVLYGHNMEPMAIVAPGNIATKTWHTAGKHRPVELTIGTRKQLAMVKSADIDPVKHMLRHLSFQVVQQNEHIDTEIPIKIHGLGETPAEKAGLVVLQALETVEVRALPANLPDQVEVPGESLAEASDHLTVADILPLTGVEIKTDPEIVVATAYEPSALAAQNDAAGGDATGEEEVPTEGDEEKAAEAPSENPKETEKEK